MFKELDKEYVLQTYDKNYTRFVSGKSATLVDGYGNGYIDFTSGIGVVSVGHGNKRLADVISQQAKNILHISNLYVIEPQVLLAKKISELSGMELGVFFANSGAEANEGAIKLARKWGNKKGKNHIITLKNSFHGRTLATLKATGQESFHTSDFKPFIDGFSFVENIDEMMQRVDGDVLAVMIELIQGEGGVNALDKLKVKKLEEICKKNDVLLIVDEVQTGVFRTGEFLCSQVYDIKPDIITLAKGLGGGVPIGAVLTRHKDIFSYGDHGSTFGGNFLVTRSALEVLGILEEMKKDEDLDKNIAYFKKKLKELVLKFPKLFSKVKGEGLMLGLECEVEVKELIKKAHKHGVLVLKAGLNTMRFLPPLNISHKEIDEGFKRLKEAFDEAI